MNNNSTYLIGGDDYELGSESGVMMCCGSCGMYFRRQLCHQVEEMYRLQCRSINASKSTGHITIKLAKGGWLNYVTKFCSSNPSVAIIKETAPSVYCLSHLIKTNL